MFASSIHSIATVFVFILLLYMIRGGLEWLIRASPMAGAALFKNMDSDRAVGRAARFLDIAIVCLILLPGILMIWGVYDTLEEALKGLMDLGFNAGDNRFTVGMLALSASILYGSTIFSWIVCKTLTEVVLPKRHVEKGVQHSIARLVHYVIIFSVFYGPSPLWGLKLPN